MSLKQILLKSIIYLILPAIGSYLIYCSFVTIVDAKLKHPDGTIKNISLPHEGRTSNRDEQFIFLINIDSNSKQNKKLHITADDEIISVQVNNEDIDFSNIRKQYNIEKLNNHRRGFNFFLPLMKGDNNILITTLNYGRGGYTLEISPVLNYLEFFLVYSLFCIPFFVFLYHFITKNYGFLSYLHYTFLKYSKSEETIPIFIILSGSLLRILYFIQLGPNKFQHDKKIHLQFINYFKTNWYLPLPDKGTEFPQQPLYYFLMGKLSSSLEYFSVQQDLILMFIRSFSTACMILVLLVAYLILKELKTSQFTLNTTLVLLAFIPRFIFLSGQISNDPFNFFIASCAIFCCLKLYRNESTKNLFLALSLALTAFFVKTSSAVILFFLFLILLFKFKKDFISKDIKGFANSIYYILIFTFFSLMAFGLALLRSHIPSTGEFIFVISRIYPGQEIFKPDLNYFLTFNFLELLWEGQSTVYENSIATIKQSFFTWQMGTMLLGEYDYSILFPNRILNQLIILFGSIIPLGLIAFIFTFGRHPVIMRIIFLPVVLNCFLIIYFVLQYPSACNADFRYYSPTYIFVLTIISTGLNFIYSSFKPSQVILTLMVSSFALVNVAWVLKLLFLT